MTRQYQVTLHSQMGPRHGTLRLEENGQKLSGTLSLLNCDNQVQGAWVGEGQIRLTHLIRSVVSDHKCVSTFRLEGDTLSGEAVTSCGVTMPWEGKLTKDAFSEGT